MGDILEKSRAGLEREREEGREAEVLAVQVWIHGPGTAGWGEVRAQRGSLQSGSVALQELPREATGPWAATGLLHGSPCSGQARG